MNVVCVTLTFVPCVNATCWFLLSMQLIVYSGTRVGGTALSFVLRYSSVVVIQLCVCSTQGGSCCDMYIVCVAYCTSSPLWMTCKGSTDDAIWILL